MVSRWGVALTLLVAALALGGCAPPREPSPDPVATTFRLVAYNAEWLLDGAGDPDAAPWQDRAAADRHLHAVAGVLGRLDADFIGLAEVENLEILERLSVLIGDAHDALFVQGTDVATGQDVAALAKVSPTRNPQRTERRAAYPVPGSALACATGDSGVSKHYAIEVTILGFPVTVLGAHLRAFPDGCKESAQREAQAAVLAALAREALHRGREVVLLGDLNDYDAAVPDVAGNRPISVVLATLKDVDPASPGDELENVCARLPQRERYTHWYDRDGDGVDDGTRELSQIDYVLVSRGLAPLVQQVAIDRSYPPGAVSDHWPVVVDFALPAQLASTP